MPQISYSIAQAADEVGLSSKTLERAVDAGDLPVITPTSKDGGRAKRLILHTDLMAWLTGDRKSA